MTVYLDANATTPIEPEVRDVVVEYLTDEFGNAGSRTHDYGARAKKAVQRARDQVAEVVGASRDEVVFTGGATESNNIAILGLAEHGREEGRTHIVTTQIEHKAVLEPCEHLAEEGFEVDFVAPNAEGWVEPERIEEKLRDDTLLVSVMHVNNETGVIQPVGDIAELVEGSDAYFHVDAAQGFGKDLETLRDERIDLISISGHKLYAPKGVGALVGRRKRYRLPPLEPLSFGGGQEKGLSPGTQPVQLIAGLGKAAELAVEHNEERREAYQAFREEVLEALMPLEPVLNGAQERCLPNTLNLAFPGVDSEALMVSLKHLIAISNGSACTSSRKDEYQQSHVLQAMGLPEDVRDGAVRLSWTHRTESPDWDEVRSVIERLQ